MDRDQDASRDYLVKTPSTDDRHSSVYVAESMVALGVNPKILPSYLRTLHHGFRVNGYVRTANCSLEDNRSAHVLLEESGEGDVLVVAASGSATAVWGGLMAYEASEKGIQAVIVDGMVRDVTDIRRSIPTFFRGVSLVAGTHESQAQIDGPVDIAGTRVNAGDWIVADEDGIVVLGYALVDKVLEQVRARERRESELRDGIRSGHGLLSLMDS